MSSYVPVYPFVLAESIYEEEKTEEKTKTNNNVDVTSAIDLYIQRKLHHLSSEFKLGAVEAYLKGVSLSWYDTSKSENMELRSDGFLTSWKDMTSHGVHATHLGHRFFTVQEKTYNVSTGMFDSVITGGHAKKSFLVAPNRNSGALSIARSMRSSPDNSFFMVCTSDKHLNGVLNGVNVSAGFMGADAGGWGPFLGRIGDDIVWSGVTSNNRGVLQTNKKVLHTGKYNDPHIQNRLMIISMHYNDLTSQNGCSLYCNGALLLTATVAAGGVDNVSTMIGGLGSAFFNTHEIDKPSGSASHCFTGKFGEFIWLGHEVDHSMILGIHEYLRKKWNLNYITQIV